MPFYFIHMAIQNKLELSRDTSMAKKDFLTLYSTQTIAPLIISRASETKIGEHFHFLSKYDLTHLAKAKQQGARFALLGISEDLGPRANHGHSGSNLGFNAFINTFINFQANDYFSGSDCLLVGEIIPPSLANSSSIETLRQSVSKLDNMVTSVVTDIIKAGLEPIVIGGGHNNAFGLLSAIKAATQHSVAAVNLDFHGDFRPLEGRHSGNGFSYAAHNGALGYYHILGLHLQKNSQLSIEQLNIFGAQWHSFQQLWVEQTISLNQALTEISQALNDTNLPVALELDLDTINAMPASAMTYAGVPLIDALHYVDKISSRCNCHYLHLAEAAPSQHYNDTSAGKKILGQVLSELVLTYINGRKRYASC